ncbi:MAG: TonB-dependent receptor [Sphingomonas sp.]
MAVAPTSAAAQQATYEIPSTSLSEALREFGRQSHKQIIFTEALVHGKRAPRVSGRFTPDEVLERLLANSDLRVETTPSGAIMIVAHKSGEGDTPTSQEVPGPGGADAGSTAADSEDAEILVTGTRIRGAGPVGSESVVVTAQDIAKSGRGTTADVIRSLPQNSGVGPGEETRVASGWLVGNASVSTPANLRGLGPDGTLILFNGHRMAPSSQGTIGDLTQIPISAIDRIEVILDGASAIYGSDAIGGVINIIPKRDPHPVSRLAYSDADGFHRITASQSAGVAWGTGALNLSYEYFKQSELLGSSRDYYTQDLRRYGGSDLRVISANPGTIVVGAVNYAIPKGQDGRHLTAAQLTAGAANFYDGSQQLGILPSQERHSLVASFTQKLSDVFSVYADGLFSSRAFFQRNGALSSSLNVPSTNPFFVSPTPGATTVNVRYNFLADFGPVYGVEGRQTDYSITGGLKATISPSWTAELFYAFGLDKLHRNIVNALLTPALNAAVADTNPATALNVFGDGSNTNPATLAKLLTDDALISQQYRINTTGVSTSGDLIDMPSGEALKVSLGAEYRVEQFKSRQVNLASGSTVLAQNIAPRRDTLAGYAEFYVPLVGVENRFFGVDRLVLSGAVRADRYSDFGSATTSKLGFLWSPLHGVSLRGSMGSSFKAPQLAILSVPTSISALQIADPGVPAGHSFVIIRRGGNPGLGPERAKTYNFGIDLEPSALPGLRASASVFIVNYRGKNQAIAVADYPLLLSQKDVYASVLTLNPSLADVNALIASPFFAGSKPDPTQIVAIVDGNFQNIGAIDQNGLDLSLSYAFKTGIGRFRLSSNTQIVTGYKVRETLQSPRVDRLNQLGFPLQLVNRSTIDFSSGNWGGALSLNYVNSYKNTNIQPMPSIPAWKTLDGVVSWTTGNAGRWLGGLDFSLAAQNLLDAEPPLFSNTAASVAYDPQAANALGRIVTFAVTKRW